MDRSISLPTPEDWQDRGAQAYNDGQAEHHHHLPENSPARKHWQYGWHQQRIVLERTCGASSDTFASGQVAARREAAQ